MTDIPRTYDPKPDEGYAALQHRLASAIPIRIAWGFIFQIYCVPKDWDDQKISDEISKVDDPGTSAGRWVVSEPCEREDDWSNINKKPCPDCEYRVHVLVNC